MGNPFYVRNFRPGEQLVAVFHPSLWAFRGSVVSNVLLWCVPFFFIIPLVRMGGMGYILGGIVLLIALWWSAHLLVTWYFTCLVVSDRRTVFHEQSGFFTRSVAEVPFRSLQDISYERRGMNATLTNFGTIVIQSASSTQRLECRRIGHPNDVVDLIRKSQAAWLQAKHSDPAYDAVYPTVQTTA